MIRVYVTRYDIATVLKCVTENPDYEIEQIRSKTHLNPSVIRESLRQLQDGGIISDVET